MHNPKYKTTLCKHFDTPQGCSYGDKCQFAHGAKELRSNNFHSFPMPMGGNNKNQNNMMNYKIVKCKNFEKDGTCKYGDHCTFAHGEKEIRNKAQNLYQINNTGMIMPVGLEMGGMPFMMQGMDMSQMQMMMPMGPNMGQNPFMMMNMMAPPNNGMNNNENNETKGDNKP